LTPKDILSLGIIVGVAGLVALVYYPDVINLIEQLQKGQLKGGLFADNPIVGKKADEVLLPKVQISTSHANAAMSYQELAAEEEKYEP
jgi:hypothetical protein